jgi:hypothetical protein
MKLILIFFLAFYSMSLTGCAPSKYNLAALAGINVRDLEKARAEGVKQTFDISQKDAFERTIGILREEKLTVFQSDRKKGYIVAMGFKEQVDTTRVGIFFEEISDNSTEITLSTLSGTALPKAKKIIFGGLSSSNAQK